MNEDQDRPRLDTNSLKRLVEAKSAHGTLDLISVQKLIENLKGSSLEDKVVLLRGAIASVDALLKKPALTGDGLAQVIAVRDALVNELDRATGVGQVPPKTSESGPAAQ